MQTFKQFLTENVSSGVALLPGGFRPPHKGHFEALRHMITENGAESAIVFLGKKERDGFTVDQSKAIWEIYTGYINAPVDVIISEVTPVKSVYEYADVNRDMPLFVGAGLEDMNRYSWFEKNAADFPLVKLVPIPPQFGRISGTDTRQKIIDNDPDALSFIPDEIHWSDKDKIADILGITTLGS